MIRPLSKTGEKTLVLRCMPFVEKAVGSAWGLPVIASGKERLSALSLSEKLEAPGVVSIGADPFRAERLLELEALGIGPLGRYVGGEPVKPVRLGPDVFFTQKSNAENDLFRKSGGKTAGAAELFCTGLEFENTHWSAHGTLEELFHAHLEFLRRWGFTGGIITEEKSLAPLLADYLYYLQKKTADANPKIIVLAPKHFFESSLAANIPNAKTGADTSAGEIPVNYNAGGIPVLIQNQAGLSIALYEDIAPLLQTQKVRCDILIAVNTGANAVGYTGEIAARLKLIITTGKPSKKEKAEIKKPPSVNSFLFRNLVPVKPGENPPAMPFPFTELVNKQKGFPAYVKTNNAAKPFDREEAAALDLLSQWEAEKAERVHGCLFAVNAKFSNIRAIEFKEEQFLFYKERDNHGQRRNFPGEVLWEVPPIAPAVSFSGLNEIQRNFFLQWRSECRRGYIHIPPGSVYIDSYIQLYARELILCMGKEGPLHHFIALMQLFHACAESSTETAEQLLAWLVDFIIVYGIGKEAFPILLKELLDNGWFDNRREAISETEKLLADCTISYFFIESTEHIDSPKSWPLIRHLVPPKIVSRKENDKELPAKFCKTLGILDTQLRREWDRGFFTVFYPPLPLKTDVRAFEGLYSTGESLYTVYRPDFSSHKPLIEILSVLALEPEKNPLPGVKARLHPLSLENELVEELRKESDAVREILKLEDGDLFTVNTAQKKLGIYEPYNAEYNPPDTKALETFIASLGNTERNAVFCVAGLWDDNGETVPPAVIDAVNSAFFEQFGDLLIETGGERPSINAEYAAILEQWESPSQNE